ncbi:MAG: isoamylase early set domain-containing protein [Anaerolineae bacterium]
MLHKKSTPGNGQVRVTFTLPYTTHADRVSVLGDFNSWDATATPMIQRRLDADWVASVELEAGRRYRFRYLLDGKRWLNDWYADDFEDNPFGTTDSVVDLSP